MTDHTIEILKQLPIWISQHFAALTQLQQTFFLMVSCFVAANLVLYCFTRGKEFAVLGFSAVLFLVPFLQFT